MPVASRTAYSKHLLFNGKDSIAELGTKLKVLQASIYGWCNLRLFVLSERLLWLRSRVDEILQAIVRRSMASCSLIYSNPRWESIGDTFCLYSSAVPCEKHSSSLALTAERNRGEERSPQRSNEKVKRFFWRITINQKVLTFPDMKYQFYLRRFMLPASAAV